MKPLIYDAFISNGGNKFVYERQSDGTLKRKELIVKNPAGCVFPILLTWDNDTGNGTLNKTWQEIKDAFTAGMLPFIYEEYDEEGSYECYMYQITMISGSTYGYIVQGIITNIESDTAVTSGYLFTCNSASGYPTYSSGGVE